MKKKRIPSHEKFTTNYNSIYLAIDGVDSWNSTNNVWTKAEVSVTSGTHTISFSTRHSGSIYLDELEFISN